MDNKVRLWREVFAWRVLRVASARQWGWVDLRLPPSSQFVESGGVKYFTSQIMHFLQPASSRRNAWGVATSPLALRRVTVTGSRRCHSAGSASDRHRRMLP